MNARSHSNRRLQCDQRQRGGTLLEVLVSILLFSFGLLGLVGLQARAAQYSVDADDRNRAALLATEASTLMLARDTLTLDPAEYAAWQAKVANATASGLPRGAGEVVVAGNEATINITWLPPKAASGSESRLSTQVVR